MENINYIVLRAIVFCTGFSIVFYSFKEKRNKKIFLVSIFVSTIIYLSFAIKNLENFNTIFICFIVAGVVSLIEKRDFIKNLFASATSILLLSTWIIFIGSLIKAFCDLTITYIFDIIMSILILIFSAVTYLHQNKKNIFQIVCKYHPPILFWIVTAEIVILFFISLILPYSILIGIRNIAYYLFISVLLLLVFLASFYIGKLEINRIISQMQAEHYSLQIKDIENKTNDIIFIKHYFNSLYLNIQDYIINDDMEGLKNYFEIYIGKINENLVKTKLTKDRIDSIRIPLINLLFKQVIYKADKILNVHITINSPVIQVYMEEMDLFIVLNEYIENAFCYAYQNQDTSIYLDISKQGNRIVFSVSNDVFQDINIIEIYQKGYSSKENIENGQGLCMTENILKKYPQVLHSVFIENGKFYQVLSIRGL